MCPIDGMRHAPPHTITIIPGEAEAEAEQLHAAALKCSSSIEESPASNTQRRAETHANVIAYNGLFQDDPHAAIRSIRALVLVLQATPRNRPTDSIAHFRLNPSPLPLSNTDDVRGPRRGGAMALTTAPDRWGRQQQGSS